MKDGRNVWMSCRLGVMLCVSFPVFAGEAPVQDVKTFRVGNEQVERHVELDLGRNALWAQGLRIDERSTNWIVVDPRQAEYAFTLASPEAERTQQLSSRDAHTNISERVESQDGVSRLSLEMQRKDQPIVVTLFYESYDGHGFVRRWASIQNNSDKTIIVGEVELESLVLLDELGELDAMYGLKRTKPEQWPVWFDLKDQDLEEGSSVDFEAGHWRNATWLMLRRGSSEGLVLGWEAYAPTRCSLNAEQELTITMNAQYQLAPGETFTLPRSFVGLYRGDTDEGCYAAHRFVEEHLAWPIPDENFPYLMFNTWGYERAIYDSLAREAIKLCEGLGVELFVTDFGWDGPNWEPLPEAFPDGLAPLAELSRAGNMKFGAHLSFGNVSEKAEMFKEHPEWVFGEGYWGYGQGKYPVYALSLGLAEARAWIVDKIVDVTQRQRIDWILTDTKLWGLIDPEKHVVKADQEYLATEGYAKTIEELRQRRPDLLIEHCDSGLSMPSYRMLEQHVTSITCDNAMALDTRISVYDLSHFLPPRYLDKYQQEWRSHYANRSCMFGGPWILMFPIDQLEVGSRDWVELTEDIAIYKRYRGRIRDGMVLHLLRPSPTKDDQWDGWDAIGSYHPGEDAAIVFAFRTKGDMESRTIPMRALQPDNEYRVAYVDSGESYEASGKEILQEGLALALDAYENDRDSNCSEIVLIEPVSRKKKEVNTQTSPRK